MNRALKLAAVAAAVLTGPASAAFGAAAGFAARAQSAAPAPVERTDLSRDAFSTGLLDGGRDALPADLWRGADAGIVAFLLERAPSRPVTPSLGEALRRTLLSAGAGPQDAPRSLGGRKLTALARAGFVDEARTIASLSSARGGDSGVAEALAVGDLLEGEVARACGRNASLTDGRDEDFWVKLRILCYAVAGERDAADLTFGLARESGALAGADEPLLAALATGAAPKTPPAPENALHLAALRQLELPLSPSLLAGADGGVLKAVAMDPAADPETRAAAGVRAAAMGVVAGEELAALYRSLPLEVADVGRAGEIAVERPDEPLTDAILFQSVDQMTAPEFLRDKASRIAQALGLADTFPRAYAAALVHADAIAALDGALIAPSEAAQFARARMIVGDGKGAARWLYAMLGTGDISAMDDESAMELIELANLLEILDPVAAAAIAETAGVALDAPLSAGPSAGEAANSETLAPIVEAAFEAAIKGTPGQAALAALAASSAAPVGDPLAAVVVEQALRAAGLDDLRRRMALEAVLKTRYAAGSGSAARRLNADAPPGEGGLAPRVKPDRE